MRYLTFISIFFTFNAIQAWGNSPPSLNIYMWEDTLSPSVANEWEKRTKTSLQLSHFDNDDERSLLMNRNTQLPFDIVVLDNVSANIYGRLGSFIDLSQIKNRKHNADKWNQACGDYAIPYFWGTVGIVYRKDFIQKPPTTWQEFVSPPDDVAGRIGMINDSIETFLPLFYSKDISPISEDPSLIAQTYPDLLSFSEKVLTFEYALSYVRSHDSSENLWMALAYSGDQYSLNRYYGSEKWAYTLPDGEAFLWVDCLAISSHSSNIAAATDFIEYISDPKVAAKNAIDVKSATPNLSALKLLPKTYLDDASLFPAPSVMENGQIDTELSATSISLRAKVINSILKRHEAQH
ncbi:spermidine/putrescine ABC transporter substrate-binding protein [Vibrio sinensis]|uniref:Spermidine/putrescine ABC transporter substrate-binding protein n=2 Tax=Vibrio sinensis TaxID=2302434 RepID=A0A3A6QDK2_9VIBR|nr:spermidine/putrescine ABC transporter substrate-binding protein [Vibrio sinensis]